MSTPTVTGVLLIYQLRVGCGSDPRTEQLREIRSPANAKPVDGEMKGPDGIAENNRFSLLNEASPHFSYLQLLA